MVVIVIRLNYGRFDVVTCSVDVVVMFYVVVDVA